MDRPPTSQPVLIDQETFTQLFEQSHIFIHRYVYGLTGGPQEEVDDLVSETYSHAWAARRRFQGSREDAIHWLVKIARHQVIDAYRWRKGRGASISLEDTDPPTSEVDPESQTIAAEKRRIIWRLLQSLNENNREILVLRYILEWPVQKIALHLGKKETAISMAIQRSLKRLQESFPVEEGSSSHA